MKYLVIIILTFILLGCENGKMNNKENIMEANSTIAPILDSFTNLNRCDKCVHELYIDKIDPHYYILYIYKGTQSLTLYENVLNKQDSDFITIRSGIKFKVYSGVEHYFSNTNIKSEKVEKIDSVDINHKTFDPILWIVKDSFNIVSVKSVPGAYPFMPLPVDVIY